MVHHVKDFILSNWQFCRVIRINIYVSQLAGFSCQLDPNLPSFAYQPYTQLATSPYNFADHQITFLRTVDREALKGELHT